MKSSSKLKKLTYNANEQSSYTEMFNCEHKIPKGKYELLSILRKQRNTLNFLSVFFLSVSCFALSTTADGCMKNKPITF